MADKAGTSNGNAGAVKSAADNPKDTQKPDGPPTTSPSGSGVIGFDKIAVRKLIRSNKEKTNATLKGLQVGQKDDEKAFHIHNPTSSLFMRYLEHQAIEFAQEAYVDQTGLFSGKLAGPSGLARWLEAIQPPIALSIHGEMRPSTTADSPVAVDLTRFGIVTPLGSKGRSLTFTTQASVLKEQFGSVCDGKNGLEAFPGHLLLALDTADPKGATIGLSDLIELSGVKPPGWIRNLLDVVTATPKPGHPGRCGIWIICGFRFDTFLRIEMQLERSKDDTGINKFISKYAPSLKLDGISIIVKRGFRQSTSLSDKIVYSEISEIWLQAPVMEVDGGEGKTNGALLSIGVGGSRLRLSLQWTQTGSSIRSIIGWVNKRLSSLGDNGAIPDLTSIFKDSFSSAPTKNNSWIDCFHMRSVGIDFAENKIYGASFMVEVDLPFGAPRGRFNTIVLSGQMEDKTFTFTGMLLSKGPRAPRGLSYEPLLDPMYETFTSVGPLPPREGCEQQILLKYLDPDNPLENIPSWLPNTITNLFLQVQYSPTGTNLTFESTIRIKKQIDGEVPIFQIKELDLMLDIHKPKSGPKNVSLSFTGRVDMFEHGAGPDSLPCGELAIGLHYQTPGYWYLKGGIQGLRMKALASFFDKDAADVVMDIFENVYLHELSIEYAFSSGAPSTLGVNARIVIANVDFSLTYKHYGKSKVEVRGARTSGKSGQGGKAQETGKIKWLIAAQAQPVSGAAIKNPTIRDWIAGIADEELASDLPPFVGNTEIPLDTLIASVKCFAVDGYTIFIFQLSIKGFGFEFAQVHENSDPAMATTVAKAGSKQGEKSPPARVSAKRILRIRLDTFPDCGTLPLVGEVKQPLEEIDFLWASTIFTRKDVELLNNYVFTSNGDSLNYKDPVAKGGKSDPSDVLIAPGFHFMVIMNLASGPTVILDYIFGQRPAKDSKSGATGTGSTGKEVASKSTAQSSQPAAQASTRSDESKTSPPAPFEKKAGPLAIANLSLKYKDQILTVIFDADVKLGPLAFALKGFGIDLHLKSVSLHDLSKLKITASLSGLGLQVKQGKVTLAGLFERIKDESTTGYTGGLSICLPQYTFLGAGGYLEDKSGFKSVFGILMVTGPLMHFGFAEVRGITGGFGYNSTLRIPMLHELDSFPLLNQSLPGDKGPLEQLKNIRSQGWITPKKDTIWMAAGLTIKAFQLIDVQAVVTVEIGDDLKIAIVGRAVATAPPQSSPDKAFVLVVLDVVASLDFGKGAFSLQGQLNPSSFILDRACHPTGGFALCSWFGNSQYAGDWVFTIGGFHPAFARPAHYPNPPRLGISWKYDRSISITGEAYFAITPQLCMGGGKLSINFDVGNISAYLIAYADFLINYEPFQYMICAGVRIGVSYTLKVWFVRVKFSVDISAQITIEGPPVSGKVYVDLKVISFTIAFGARRTKRPALTLSEFWALLVQTGNSKDTSDHIFGVAAGLIPLDEPSKGHLGTLRAGVLEIQVHSRAAISQIYLGNSVQHRSRLADQIYAKPTRVQKCLKSDLKATIMRRGSPGTADIEESDKFRVSPIYKHMPSALWACYDPQNDPSDDRANTAALRSSKPATYEHLMGFSITPREPQLSLDKLPKFSVDDLIEASGGKAEIEDSMSTPSRFLPGLKATTKSKIRGFWGGNTTTTPVNINKVLQGFSKGLEVITKKESRYANLPTAAPKKLFEDFDLIYSAGAPRLASSQDNQPPDLVAGEWSTKWEKSSAYKISSVNRSSIDLEKYANGIVLNDPRMHFGINRIDYQKSASYRFNTFIDFRKYAKTTPSEIPDEEGQGSQGKVMTINAHSWSGSVLNECDVTWLAVFDNSKRMSRIQTGICSVGNTSKTGLPNPSLGKTGNSDVRTTTVDVNFGTAYDVTPPKVVVWLTGVNVSGPGNPKFKVEVKDKDITLKGCKIEFTTWGEGIIAGISCSWLAHPAGSPRIQSGNFSTLDLRSPFTPRKITTNRVAFDGFKFERKPTLLVAFNHIECGSDNDLRAGVTASDVKTNGFTWHCSTWGFTDLHVASAAYVAFDA